MEEKQKHHIMTKELKKQVDEMDLRYRNAYKDIDRVFKRMGKKDMYFILKRYYKYQPTAYTPKFEI